MAATDLDRWHMAHAIELAARGRGHVEPNPQVGCLITRGAEIIGEGWHRRFGGAHAETEALAVAGARARGATLYCTLEPCRHHGKTGPCTQAIIAAGLARVVVALRDPHPLVAGQGIAELVAAGIEVETGVLEAEARWHGAPYLKLVGQRRPWVIAKWAMTLDGKLATETGDSRWISNEQSRRTVHELRGRVDAILVGRGTVERDDPLLTARPPGPRVPTRIVLDRGAQLPPESQLVRTIDDAPVLVAAGAAAPRANVERLASAGVEVFATPASASAEQLAGLLDELGRRQMTNLLIEGGSRVLGAFFDAQLIDEVHVFVAPKLAGGAAALSPLGGQGTDAIAGALQLERPMVSRRGDDVYLVGRVSREG